VSKTTTLAAWCARYSHTSRELLPDMRDMLRAMATDATHEHDTLEAKLREFSEYVSAGPSCHDLRLRAEPAHQDGCCKHAVAAWKRCFECELGLREELLEASRAELKAAEAQLAAVTDALSNNRYPLSHRIEVALLLLSTPGAAKVTT